MDTSQKINEALNQSAPAILRNRKILTYRGLADGTTKLAHEFLDKIILNQKLKIDFIRFDWFTDATIWVVDAIYDNKVFTVNANTRYELTTDNNKIKLKSPLVETLGVAPVMAVYNLLINNSPMNLFNKISDVNFGTKSL